MEDLSNSTTPIILRGWTGNPQERGTFDILSSCLVAIVASTWTILHLNVPGHADSTTAKFFRKLKWMVFTMIFPEFLFAHAMEERLMAYMVLERLRDAGVKTKTPGERKIAVAAFIGNLEWREAPSILALFVPYPHQRRSARAESDNDTFSWLHRLLRFQNHAQSSEDGLAKVQGPKDFAVGLTAKVNHSPESPQPIGQEGKTNSLSSEQTHEWTIVHAIFANMGGFRLAAEDKNGIVQRRTISGFQLASLLKTRPLSDLPKVSKEQILDKSKTDNFTRWLAILQCLWLLLEMIARKVESLPSSQLEVATIAFACCSVLTYLAVRDKPKDVGVALDIVSTSPQIESIVSSPDPLFQRPVSYFLEIFCYRPWQPEGYNGLLPPPWRRARIRRCFRWGKRDPERIPNDNYLVRNYRSHPMAGWLVIGTTVFGGIHCIAWNYYFPSRLEQKLWRAAALVTTLAPLLLPIIDRGATSFQRRFNFSSSSRAAVWFLNFWATVPPLAILLAYVTLRICIIGLIFSSFRALPEGVYNTTWTRYLLSVH